MTDAPSMAGKYVLGTGGTDGIGKATAAGLAALLVGVRCDPEADAASAMLSPASPVHGRTRLQRG